jgi:hypothetical protein
VIQSVTNFVHWRQRASEKYTVKKDFFFKNLSKL